MPDFTKNVKETGKRGVCVLYHAPSGQGCKNGENCEWLHDHEILEEDHKVRVHKLERQKYLQRQLDQKQHLRDRLEQALGDQAAEYKQEKNVYYAIRLPGFHKKTQESKKKVMAIQDTVKTDVKRSRPDSISPDEWREMPLKMKRSIQDSSATGSNPQD